MKNSYYVLALAGMLFCGCHTTISYNSADLQSSKNSHHGPQCQLKESDVLGLTEADAITDEQIKRVLEETKSIKLKPGSTVMLVESGAKTPDTGMSQELGKLFTVVPHTGIAREISTNDLGRGFSKELRLAAAQSQAEYLLVYWGNLEVRRDDLPTSLVSWVPVVDFVVPDEYQKMRMSLKMALIDVRTGNWATFRTEPVEGDVVTTRYAREHGMKWPFESFKQKLYAQATEKLKNGYIE